jgi:hypothetical protein
MASKAEAEVRKVARRLLEEAEFLRQEAQARGERFEFLDEEALVARLMRGTTNSPFLQRPIMG